MLTSKKYEAKICVTQLSKATMNNGRFLFPYFLLKMDEIIQQCDNFYELGAKHERQKIYQILDEFKLVVELLSH